MTPEEQAAFDKGLDEYQEEQLRTHIGIPEEQAFCIGCHRTPAEIQEYQTLVDEDEYSTPDKAVESDGTYNRANHHFWCTTCYIAAGLPLGVAP